LAARICDGCGDYGLSRQQVLGLSPGARNQIVLIPASLEEKIPDHQIEKAMADLETTDSTDALTVMAPLALGNKTVTVFG
jgi:hypothetical protein